MRGRRRRAPDISGRVAALEAALEAGGDRLDPVATVRARGVLERTGRRYSLGASKTVVALAGATGSGKSSLFNALAGMEIAEAGPRRPTTSTPLACVWGPDDADALLDWLQVPGRHRTARESVLDADRQASLHGLVLLDLPDHDSAVAAHRDEVDRLVDLADLVVWVLDPQKYADEALHAGYLKPLAGHDTVMLVVLNQVDRLGEAEIEACRRDLRRLLDADGLESVRLLTVSARRGDGIGKLREMLAEVVRNQGLAMERAGASLDTLIQDLRAGVAESEPQVRSLPVAKELMSALAAAAGVPVLLDAVAADYVQQARCLVGWPFLRWVRRLGPDRVSRLGLGSAEADLRRIAEGTAPAASLAQESRVELAIGDVTSTVAHGLPPRWAESVRRAVRAAQSGGVHFSQRLDAAVAGVSLQLRAPRWWRAAWVGQLTLATAMGGGLVWLGVLGVLDQVRSRAVTAPELGPVPVPLALVGGGFVLGMAFGVAGRFLVRAGGRRRREVVAAQLAAAVVGVADERVLAPIDAVLTDHRRVREALASVR